MESDAATPPDAHTPTGPKDATKDAHTTTTDTPITAKYTQGITDTLNTSKDTHTSPSGTPSLSKDAYGTRSNTTTSLETLNTITTTANTITITTTDHYSNTTAEQQAKETLNITSNLKNVEGENANSLPDDPTLLSLPLEHPTTAKDSRVVIEVESPSTNKLDNGTGLSEAGRDIQEGKIVRNTTQPQYNSRETEKLLDILKEDKKVKTDVMGEMQSQNDGQYHTSDTKPSSETQEDGDESVKMLRKILQEAQEAIQRFRMDFQQPPANLTRSNLTASIPWEKFVADKTAQRILRCSRAREGEEEAERNTTATKGKENVTNLGKEESETIEENPIRHNRKDRKKNRHGERKGRKGNRKRRRGGNKGNNKDRIRNTRRKSQNKGVTLKSKPTTPYPLPYLSSLPLVASSPLTPTLPLTPATPTLTLWDTWHTLLQHDAKLEGMLNTETVTQENESKTLIEETLSDENVRSILEDEKESEETG